MDINISNDAAFILALGGFAIACVYWAGRIVVATQLATAADRRAR